MKKIISGIIAIMQIIPCYVGCVVALQNSNAYTYAYSVNVERYLVQKYLHSGEGTQIITVENTVHHFPKAEGLVIKSYASDSHQPNAQQMPQYRNRMAAQRNTDLSILVIIYNCFVVLY